MEVLCRLSYSGGTRDDSNVHSARILVVVLAIAVPACANGSPEPRAYPVSARFETSAGDAVLRVSVADTERARARGLMGVEDLPEGAGMAFVWDEPVYASFWMKDTLIPLSIAFADERGRIEAIREMPPCRADPCPLYSSAEPTAIAIEANAGWFDRHGVDVGDRVTLEFGS